MAAQINYRFELKFHKIFVQFPLMKMTRRHCLNSRREIRRRSRRIVWKASSAAGAYDHHRKSQTPSFSIMSQFGVWRAAFFTTKSRCRIGVRNVVERTPNVPSDFNACTERGRWSDVTWQQHENAYTHNGCKEDNGGDRDYDEESQWLRRILLRHYSLCAWANDSLRDPESITADDRQIIRRYLPQPKQMPVVRRPLVGNIRPDDDDDETRHRRRFFFGNFIIGESSTGILHSIHFELFVK